jgi:hypothetical protein
MRSFLFKTLIHIQILFLKVKFYNKEIKKLNPNKLKLKLDRTIDFDLNKLDIKTLNPDDFFSNRDIEIVSTKSYYFMFALPYKLLFNSIHTAKQGTELDSHFFFYAAKKHIMEFNLEVINYLLNKIDTFDHADLSVFLRLAFKVIPNLELSSNKYKFTTQGIQLRIKQRETDIYFEQANALFARKGLSPKDGCSDNAYHAYRCANDLKITKNYYTLSTLLAWEIKYNKDVLKPLSARYKDLSQLINFVESNNSSCKDDIIKTYQNEMLSLERNINSISSLIEKSEISLNALNSKAA